MSRKQFEIVGTIGPDTEMMGTTHAKVQDAVSAAFQAQFELQRKYESARAAYVAWLDAQPEETFAPATRAEVLALYDSNSKPGASAAAEPVHSATLDLVKMLDGERVEELAISADEKKTLAAYHIGDMSTRYVALAYAQDAQPEQLLYSGMSLALAVDCYNRRAPLVPATRAEGTSITDRIAQLERIPARKAALDRARIRRALATIRMTEIGEMTPEQAIEALCQTPEGTAQYELIRTRAPGSPYKPLGRRDDGVSVEELITTLVTTSETAAEFEQASRDVRQVLGLEGGRELLQTLAAAVAQLLEEARSSISEGVESDGPLEPDWSREDKALLGSIEAIAKKLDPKGAREATPADVTAALKLLVQARDTLSGGLESNMPMEAEWSQSDKSLVQRINAVLENVHAKELLALTQG